MAASGKIRLLNQRLIEERLARETQALSWNFSISVANLIKHQFELFLFSKR